MTVKHQLKAAVMCLAIAGVAAVYLIPRPTAVEPAPEPEAQQAVKTDRPPTPAPNAAAASSQSAQLAKRLAALEQRVADIRATPPAAEPRAKPSEDGEASPAAASGADLGAWMTETIRGEEWDRKRTEQVEDELATALAKVPNLSLENVECGRRFCSSTFTATDGKASAVAALWGLPPLDGEGFTRTGPTGEISVYFTKPGESLDRLQQEASLAERSTN
jgi:hypothetical protein